MLTPLLKRRKSYRPGFGIAPQDFTLGDNGYLPQELFDIIIDLIVDDPLTLCAFSGVCRAWCLAARPYRLRSVWLTNRNAQLFKQLLRTSPTVRGMVRRLRVDCWRPHPGEFTQAVVPPDLRFVAAMRNVTALRLDALVVTPSLVRQLAGFFAQIAELTLGELHIVSLYDIAHLTRTFTSVRKLTLIKMPWLHPPSIIKPRRWWYLDLEYVHGSPSNGTRSWFRTKKMAVAAINGLRRIFAGRRRQAYAWSPWGGGIFFEPLLCSLPILTQHLIVHESACFDGDYPGQWVPLGTGPIPALSHIQHIEFIVTRSVCNLLPNSDLLPRMLRCIKPETADLRSIRVIWELSHPLRFSTTLSVDVMLWSMCGVLGRGYTRLEDVTFELVGDAPPSVTEAQIGSVERVIAIVFQSMPNGVVKFENHIHLQANRR